ncbi:hypothetical protein, partial [Sediminimonas qiaohouensis]|uniref:hypothetical protein n=1 Tax=Sediminimonas qiaohouensis TaxID=552061 RepID=UPI002357C421
QKSHVDHSDNPQLVQAGERLHMGQVSVTILAVAGSGLSDNQQTAAALIVPRYDRSLKTKGWSGRTMTWQMPT